MKIWSFGSLCAFVALIALGCAGRGDIAGKVTINNKPVVTGTITFVASDKIAYQSPIREDGSYSVSKVPAGEAKIAVDSPKPSQGRSAREKELFGDRGDEPVSTIDPKNWVPIPSVYQHFDKSGLTYTVKSGKQEFNLDLKPK